MGMAFSVASGVLSSYAVHHRAPWLPSRGKPENDQHNHREVRPALCVSGGKLNGRAAAMEWWPFGAESCRKFYKRSRERSRPSPVPTTGAFHLEEARIRAAYAKRQQDDARYSYFSMGHLYMMQEREQRLLTLLKRHDFAPLTTKRILEVGCGTGYWLREFMKWGARPEHITGIDLLVDRVAEARALCPKAISILSG